MHAINTSASRELNVHIVWCQIKPIGPSHCAALKTDLAKFGLITQRSKDACIRGMNIVIHIHDARQTILKTDLKAKIFQRLNLSHQPIGSRCYGSAGMRLGDF